MSIHYPFHKFFFFFFKKSFQNKEFFYIYIYDIIESPVKFSSYIWRGFTKFKFQLFIATMASVTFSSYIWGLSPKLNRGFSNVSLYVPHYIHVLAWLLAERSVKITSNFFHLSYRRIYIKRIGMAPLNRSLRNNSGIGACNPLIR